MKALSLFEQVVSRHFSSKVTELQAFGKTGYSFEEWFNWELYYALGASDSNLAPKPTYKAHGLDASKKTGDVFFSLGDENFIIEVALVHDYTQDKWLEKIRLDRDHLMTLKQVDGITPIQLIAMVSGYNDIMAQESWSTWLESLTFWNTPRDVDIKLRLPTEGQAWIIGWSL
ncbi:hypothetical protein SAMN05661010_02261 [Modicisalibacter muralis]|uniref:Uncharacterized protein n=1 Tax=Modicisalibacter muralis TaxID=119000 RepID=A0A1G9M2L1_9GAMM|nr:hypothetical protein [Halomonas muralis]SDL68177.1 hypothetical protein SAMN05661010_02261 [Halomonas muralis]